MKKNRSSSALGDFLKSRRERLQPSEAGIHPLPGRRRTPGLRREEVSYLAHISVTYYAWLEQGKEVNPSPEVLLSISKALQLDEDEQKHLFDLVNVDMASVVTATNNREPDTKVFQQIVDQLHYPSFITDEGTDIIVWNRAAELIVADFGSLPDNERNMMNIMFLRPDYRNRLVNWESFARYAVAVLRAGFDLYKNNPFYMERFERLRRESVEFVHFWELYEIKQKRVATALFRLPDAQEMEFELHSSALIDNDPGLHWCFFVPVPGSGTEERLVRLLEQDRRLP
ncbi:helix-turn-helix transcriptional regulator [Gracilibacillus caseinilyticus]|uniref:Helix-turn-helix transcriptional regulator n=1 Tax=Gracilibacillus caseinilyticus TaxID=2932256 RepID=A0ABY4F2P3_9BACI|nr:helix-turn-helix transcriptional regulator [Gracilibacillus caseinilyticus]UOQ50343.1 helix-turn-helix transcriptional regulator [Gracilibacillus caseinilyticus]